MSLLGARKSTNLRQSGVAGFLCHEAFKPCGSRSACPPDTLKPAKSGKPLFSLIKTAPHLVYKRLSLVWAGACLTLFLTAPLWAWEGVIVHHSDSESMSLQQCNEWHKARGWDGCGYNFIIHRDGSVETARGWNKVGAHCRGFNKKFLGVCFVGKEFATQKQLDAFKNAFGKMQFFGHRDFGRTLCPASMLPQLKDYLGREQ